MGSPDDTESEGQVTELYEDQLAWLPPVDTIDDLPTEGVQLGAFCFVSNQGAVYQYTEEGWFTTKTGLGED